MVLLRESALFDVLWSDTLLSNDDITLLMFCASKYYQTDANPEALDFALKLFQMAIDHNLTKFTVLTYCYFIELLMMRFGAFSEIAADAVSQCLLLDEADGVLNVHQMTANMIPALIRCFVFKLKSKSKKTIIQVSTKNIKKSNNKTTKNGAVYFPNLQSKRQCSFDSKYLPLNSNKVAVHKTFALFPFQPQML